VKQNIPLEERFKKRIKAISLIEKGYTLKQVATIVGISKHTVIVWRNTYRKEGTKGLLQFRRSKPTRKLTDEQEKELILSLRKGAEAYGFEGNWWSPVRVRKAIQQLFGVEFDASSINQLLKRHNLYARPSAKRNILKRLLAVVKANSPKNFGFEQSVWNAALVAKVCFQLFERRYSEDHIYRYFSQHGWSFVEENNQQNTLKKLIDIVSSKKAKLYGFETDVWTAQRIVILAKTLYKVDLSKAQVYAYMRRHGFPLGSQEGSKFRKPVKK
jgi:transposase